MKARKIFALVFALVIVASSILNLTSMAFNGGSLKENFAFEKYAISLKNAIFNIFGVKEYNGVYVENDMLIEISNPTNDVVTLENIEILKNITAKVEKPIYFSLIPNAEYLSRSTSKRRNLMWDQEGYIENVYYRLIEDLTVVDVTETLYNYSDDDIFFKTQNQLSPKGGYHIFQTVMKHLDYQVIELQKYDVEYHSDLIYGELSYKLGNFNLSDKIEFYRYPFYKRNVSTKITDKNGVTHAYKDVYLDKENGFNAYLGGENPLTVIRNTETFSERILVVSDRSFNVMAGFFVDYFEEITFVNPFACNENAGKINADDYDYVIFMLTADNFNNQSLSHLAHIIE